MADFGDRLKAIRLEKELSQEEFAKLLHTSKQVISRYETKQRTPKITVVNEYAKCLNISLTYLLGETDQLSPYFPQETEQNGQSRIQIFTKGGPGESFTVTEEEAELFKAMLKAAQRTKKDRNQK